jgi:hypothetical protein
MGDEQMMTRRDVMAFLRVSLATVKRLDDCGRLKRFSTGKSLIRYRRSDVLACLDAATTPPSGEVTQ